MSTSSDDPFSKQDWKQIIKRLTAYAKRRLGRKATIQEAEDIASEAIRQVLDPDYRDWDPAKEELIWHLQSNVNGIINNRRRTKSLAMEQIRDFGSEASQGLTARDSRHECNEKHDASALLERVRACAAQKGDEVAEQVILLAAIDAVFDVKDVAVKLNVSVGKVYEARRRLKEYLEAVLPETEEQN